MEHTDKRCLFISDRSFYSYSEKIEKELISLGYNLTLCNHEYPDSNLGKILSKLHINIPLHITQKTISRRFLNGVRFDLVLIIKGRGISQALILKIKQASGKIIGYNYDSFTFNNSPLKWFRQTDNYCTFDYADAEKYKLPVVELFSCLPENKNVKKIRYEISAIMRNHSARIYYLDRILSVFPDKTKYIYIFEMNMVTSILNFIKNPFLYLKYFKHIRFKSLSYNEYTDVMYGSNFTLDYVYPSQTGISLRCFEALASQTKIITNNPYVFRNKHFNNMNTIIFEKSTSQDILRQIYEKIRIHLPDSYIRTVSEFISDLTS